MPTYRFKRVETVEHIITVEAADVAQAYARVRVGPMDKVREKESIRSIESDGESHVISMAWVTSCGDNPVQHETLEDAIDWMNNQNDTCFLR